MKYCLSHPKNKYLEKTDEISIVFPGDMAQLDLKKMIDSLLKYKDKKINIVALSGDSWIDNDGIHTIQAIKQKYPELDLHLSFPDLEVCNPELIEAAKHYKIPFFLRYHVSNWSALHLLIELGVNEMYITNSLCFELDKVSDILHEHGIKIRMFPNIAQTEWPIGNNLKAAYVCPHDIKEYEPYVDVFEFIYNGKEQEEALYHTYAVRGEWLDKMKFIIFGLESDIDSRFVIPHFAQKRISCGQKCLKGNPCKMCERCEEMSSTLDKKD